MMTERFLSTQVAELERKYVALAQAANALYRAGFWYLQTDDIGTGVQARLWENLRDALGLQPGGPIVTNTPRLLIGPEQKAAA
jgi:hypothetical protein